MTYRKREDGFSLIEVLIATIILCTIIPLTSYFLNSMKTNNKTELQQTANYVAQKYMEEYKAKSLVDLAALWPTSPISLIDPETGLDVEIYIELDPIVDPYAGRISVTGYSGSFVDINLDGTPYAGATDGDTYILKIHKPGSKEELQLGKEDGTGVVQSFELKDVKPACANRLIRLTIKDDPEVTFKVKNELPDDLWVVFLMDTVNPSPHFVLEVEGKATSSTNTVSTERGAKITVTVKKGLEELTKVAQARKM